MPLTIYLIDGHALAYRAYFALTRGNTSGFTTRSGEPTAGVFGFTSILLRLLEQDQPEYMAIAFDTGKTFRDDIFPEYKGTREKMPDDLRSQIERIRQLVDAFNMPRLEINGYEADDVLGSTACRAVREGYGVKIITGDRDLLQLVDERTIVNLPGKSIADARDYTIKDVIEYLGVRPDQVVDYKALIGDKSDNIPGVAGVGEKTATTLLREYDTLDNIYTHLDELSASIRNKLIASRDLAYLSQKLATIVKDLDIPLDFQQARLDRFEPAKVEAIFRELEFRSLFARLTAVEQQYGKPIVRNNQQLTFFSEAKQFEKAQPRNVTGELQVQIVDSPQALLTLTQRLADSDMISFDTETTSIDQMSARLVGISLATDGNTGYYIPVGHVYEGAKQLPLGVIIEALKKPLTDVGITKAGHNLKYDYIILKRYGLDVKPLSMDTMIAEWLTNPSSRNLGLKNLAWVRQDYRMTSIEELIGKGKNQITMAEVPIEKAAAYAAADAAIIFHLIPELINDLEQCQATKLFNEIEMPLVTVLAKMEMTGIKLDVGVLEEMSGELGERLDEIGAKVYRSAGETFNLNSPQQLSEVLFDRLKIDPPGRSQRTSSGFYSTAAGVLEALSGKHPVVDLILEYRELSKIKSTYLDALPQRVNPETGRVHTSYNQTGSVTGRIASSDPNLQNIPIRSDLGRKVRRAFIANQGCVLLSVDYSQVELRIVANIANDQGMLAAFRSGQDIHVATAAAIYGIPLQEVTKEQRRHAKAINFGLIYGMSPFGLTRTTDLTLAEAENFVSTYFQQFPGIKIYLDQVRRQAYEQGYVETLLGRRRYFPGLKTQKNQNVRSREEREAINAPIQGTAADIMKIAMLKVHKTLKETNLQARMLLQVHDELVLECAKQDIAETAKLVKQVMQESYRLNIPLLTEAKYGLNWDEMQDLDLEAK
jgi:DNA polymerase-1